MCVPNHLRMKVGYGGSFIMLVGDERNKALKKHVIPFLLFSIENMCPALIHLLLCTLTCSRVSVKVGGALVVFILMLCTWCVDVYSLNVLSLSLSLTGSLKIFLV